MSESSDIEIDATVDEWEGILREHGMRGTHCICGAWWTASDEYGSVGQFRRHLAIVIAGRVTPPAPTTGEA